MKVVAHLSDPHFGTEDPAVADGLHAELDGRELEPPAVVLVSGDLTQRAKEEQFKAARAWLDSLPSPWLAVPGNHDVPLYDLWDRFVNPLKRYRELFHAELMPTFVDDELAVVGLNTAHGFTVKDGKVSVEQARAAAEVLADHPDRFKIVVAHHPFVLPHGVPERDRVDGAGQATPILRDAGAEVILTGHLHVSHFSDTGGFRDDTRSIIAVHAGTCMSTRLRGEANGYNRLILDGDVLTIHARTWRGDHFADLTVKTYRRIAGTWIHAPEEAAEVA